MVVYVDASSLVDPFVEEAGSVDVSALIAGASLAGTSLLTYVEAQAALARRHVEGGLSTGAHRRALAELEATWASLCLVRVTQDLVRAAGDGAAKHRLRGHDAVHLASALALRRDLGVPVVFSSFDEHLGAAARREGFALRC